MQILQHIAFVGLVVGLALAQTPTPSPIISDNVAKNGAVWSDAGFSLLSGSSENIFGGSTLFARQSGLQFSMNFPVPSPGYYEFAIFLPNPVNSPNSGRETAASIDVSFDDTNTIVVTDFTTPSGPFWMPFGNFLITGNDISASFQIQPKTVEGITRAFTHHVDAFRLQPLNFKPQVQLSHDAGPLITTASSVVEITATFSEPVSFTQLMLTLDGGTIIGFVSQDATTYVISVLVDSDRVLPLTASIAAEVAADETEGEFNLFNAASTNNVMIPVDTKRPIPTLSSQSSLDGTVLNQDIDFFDGTITFDEAVTGFVQADITVTQGTIVAFQETSPTVFTFRARANTASTGSMSVSVSEGVANDANGNSNAAGPDSLAVTIDTLAPSVSLTHSISSAVNSLSPAATITITFSEPVTDFDVTDITAINGNLSDFSGTGASYFVVVTPSAEVQGRMRVSIAAAVCSDLNGNDNTASTGNVDVTIETTLPTVILTHPGESSVQPGDIITSQTGQFFIRAMFSEIPAVFDTSMIIVNGGTLERATQDTVLSFFSLRLTANVESESDLSVEIPSGAAIDSSDNPNPASNVLTIPVDTTKPTIVLSLDPTVPSIVNTSTDALTLTIQLSEDVVGFDISDLSLQGVTSGALDGSGTLLTALLTPLASSTTALRVEVLSGRMNDNNGNPNQASNVVQNDIDTARPTLTISTSAVPNTFDVTTLTPQVTVSFLFSEPVQDFDLGDVQISGGSLELFASSTSALYTAHLNVPLNSTTSIVISSASGAASDLADNPSLSASKTLTVNTQDPRYLIETSGGQQICSFPFSDTCTTTDISISNPTATVTFKLTEPVSNFDFDLLVGITPLTPKPVAVKVSNSLYRVTITPPLGTVGNLKLRVPPANCDPCPVDVDFNVLPTAEMVFTTDLKAPLVTVTNPWPTCGNVSVANFANRVATLSVEFDETVSFPTNGAGVVIRPTTSVLSRSVSTPTDTGFEITVTLKPDIQGVGNLDITVPLGIARDSLLNSNSLQQNIISIPLDTKRPSISILSSFAGVTSVSKFTRDITLEGTFSEDVMEFDASAVSVEGGAITRFEFQIPRRLIVEVTVKDNSRQEFVLQVIENAITDEYCNGNLPASIRYNVDTVSSALEVEVVLFNVTSIPNREALRSALAAPIEGVSRDVVTILSVESNTEQKQQTEESVRVRSALLVPPTAEKRVIADQYYAAASSGELVDSLENEGIDGVTRVEVSKIQDDTFFVFERPFADQSNDGLSTPLIAVLAVVILFFIVLFFLLCYVFKKMVEKMQDVEEKNIERENSQFASELMNTISGEGGAQVVFKMHKADSSQDGSDRFLELQDQSFQGGYPVTKPGWVGDQSFMSGGMGPYGHGMSPTSHLYYGYGQSQEFGNRPSFAGMEGQRPSFQEPPLMVAFSEEDTTPRRVAEDEDELGPEIAATLKMLEDGVGDLMRETQDHPELELDSVLQLLEEDVGEISRLVSASDSPDALRDAISGVLTRSGRQPGSARGVPKLSRTGSKLSEKSVGSHARKPSSGGGSFRGITLTPRSPTAQDSGDSDPEASASDRMTNIAKVIVESRHREGENSVSDFPVRSGVSSGSEGEGNIRVAQPLHRVPESPRNVIEFEDEEQEGQ